jgi:branched-chain amino acid transport system ATP-binding protein
LALLELRDVAGLSLTVAEGDVVALTRNPDEVFGAILGTVRTDGEVLLDGTRLYRRTPERLARSGVTHVAAGGGIIARLTVAENLRLASWTQRGASTRELARVFEAIPSLYEPRGRRADTLRADERRLLALARVMIAKPRLLLAAQPTYGVDAHTARELFELLHAINARGAAVVIADEHETLVQRLTGS